MHIFRLVFAIFIIFLVLTVIVDASTEHKQSFVYLGYMLLSAFAIGINLHYYIIKVSK